MTATGGFGKTNIAQTLQLFFQRGEKFPECVKLRVSSFCVSLGLQVTIQPFLFGMCQELLHGQQAKPLPGHCWLLFQVQGGWRGSDSGLAWDCTATQTAKERDFDHTLGKSCHFPHSSVVLQGAVCPVLVCSAVSVEVVGDFRKEGSWHCAC